MDPAKQIDKRPAHYRKDTGYKNINYYIPEKPSTTNQDQYPAKYKNVS